MNTKQSFKDKCFKDEKGTVVIGQAPNLPLKVAILSLLLGMIFKDSTFSEFIRLLSFGAFFTFAWLELFQGVNYVRRLFGLLVLIGLFISQLT